MRRLILAGAIALPLWACGGGDDPATSLLRRAIGAGSSAHDPCSLVSGPEAGAWVGPLVSPPYRSSDGVADARGDECTYRGRDGRQVTLRPEWEGGALIGKVLQGVPDGVGRVLGRADPGFDSLAHMVMKPEAGPWDHATWIPSGALFATKGAKQIQVDVGGASGRESDALAIAKIAVPRLAHPLDYDGSKAVALAPRPAAHPARACDLVPRSAVEAAIGRLDGPPTSDAPETDCTWRVRTPEGERTYAVEFVWQGGEKNYRMLTHGMSMVGGMLGLPGGASALDSMKLPPNVQSMVGGFMKSLAGSSAGGGPGSATGAVATVGFRTDTALKGPWDNAALLHGTQLLAVRHDVFVGLQLVSADYGKAKALLGAICSRL